MTDTAGQDPDSQAGGADGQDPNAAGGAKGGTTGGKPTAGQDPARASGRDSQLTPEATAEALKKTRAEAAEHRTSAKKAAKRAEEAEGRLAKVLKMLGGEEEIDPEKAAAEVTRLTAENRILKGRQAFDKAARGANADADLTFAVLQSAGKLDDLDFGDSAAVTALIKEAVKANPKLSAGEKQKIGAGGGDGGDSTTADVNSWIRREAGRSS